MLQRYLHTPKPKPVHPNYSYQRRYLVPESRCSGVPFLVGLVAEIIHYMASATEAVLQVEELSSSASDQVEGTSMWLPVNLALGVIIVVVTRWWFRPRQEEPVPAIGVPLAEARTAPRRTAALVLGTRHLTVRASGEASSSELEDALADFGAHLAEGRGPKTLHMTEHMQRDMPAPLAELTTREKDALLSALHDIEVPDGFRVHLFRFCPSHDYGFGMGRGFAGCDFVLWDLPDEGRLKLHMNVQWAEVYTEMRWTNRKSTRRLTSHTFQLHILRADTGALVSEKPVFGIRAPPLSGPYEETVPSGPPLSPSAKELLAANGTLTISDEAISCISDDTYICSGNPVFLILVSADLSDGLVLDAPTSYQPPTVFEPVEWFEYQEEVEQWQREMQQAHPGSTGSPPLVRVGVKQHEIAAQVQRLFPRGLASAQLRRA